MGLHCDDYVDLILVLYHYLGYEACKAISCHLSIFAAGDRVVTKYKMREGIQF